MNNSKLQSLMALLIAALLCTTIFADSKADEYLTGGPLAGLKLPPYPTQHGEKPGYPGCIPGKFDSDGQAPELELYPGSVEHYRSYYDKYLPVRGMFDRQTQLKNWVAPTIPGADASRIEDFAEPVYYVARHGGKRTQHTGLYNKPVKVVRCAVRTPVFKLDLGELNAGLYAVRVIGAVEMEKMRPFREPLFITMRVNDGLDGKVNTYRIRCGYVDEFYSVAEIYFHATTKRRFQAELFVDEGSSVDLLVHNITLDDVLAPMIHKRLKTQMTLHQPGHAEGWARGYKAKSPDISAEQRLARDRAIWQLYPPINAQAGRQPGLSFSRRKEAKVTPGVDGADDKQIVEQYGKWEPVHRGIIGPISGARFNTPEDQWHLLLVNQKLGLTYSIEDLHAGRPLPDPYPYKDDGAGLYFPDPKDPYAGRWWTPVASEVGRLYTRYHYLAGKGAHLWQSSRHEQAARDGAIALVRYAYQFPAMDNANQLAWITHEYGPAYSADPRCRKRTVATHWQGYQGFLDAVKWYDMLFDYIKGNDELARSVNRFVPWVEDADDVLELLDVYLLQHSARRVLRYQDLGDPSTIAIVAAALGDKTVGDQWMQMALTRVHEYPNRPAGIQDLLISNTDRNGCLTIGSTSYAGQGAIPMSSQMMFYVNAVGGADQFDLRRLSPKPFSHFEWTLNTTIAGQDFARIGDVNGPDKPLGYILKRMTLPLAKKAWRWTKDPRYAWIAVHAVGREQETDEQWREFESAAAGVSRAPWLDLPSRVVPNWFAVLETGLEHDDPRFRRAAYVRSGVGTGHEHYDSLDLQIVAHGLPMTIDGGQRSGYSKPNDRYTTIHNLVEVSGDVRSSYGHPQLYSWAESLSDVPGARYMRVNADPPPHASMYERQVVLVDVDEGQGSRPLSLEEQQLGAELDSNVTTANSYVVDVFRVAGGKIHTYGFHGPIHDEFKWNVKSPKPVQHVASTRDQTTEANFLSAFEMSDGRKFAGESPNQLVATWRYRREPFESGNKMGLEPSILGKKYDPSSPRKFTRLHLLEADGLRALRANVVCYKWGYDFTHLMAQKRGKDLQSTFVAVIEPYAGQPFVKSTRQLPVRGAGDDADRPVAVEVHTTNGHRDMLLLGNRGGDVYQSGNVSTDGEFAVWSTKGGRLRMATITGGTRLVTPDVRIMPAAAAHVSSVKKVDYANNTIWLDSIWPAADTDIPFVIGTSAKWTSYTATRVEPAASGTKLTLRRGADYYRSRITRVVQEQNRVDCVLNIPVGTHHKPASSVLESNEPGAWVASNDQGSRFWRAHQVGGNDFILTGGKVSAEDFEPAGVLRLWEYGAGDTAKLVTHASIRLVDQNTYRIETNIDTKIELRGRAAKVSTDGQSWLNAGEVSGGWIKLNVKAGAKTLIRLASR